MSIVLEHLTKRYDGHPVVNNLSLEVDDGEFFVLLGSSGSGKTTVLSMIAGLISIDAGRVLLHGRDVTHLPTQERRVGFVFQHYALFQHMSVADNIEFGLRVRRVAAAGRRRRCEELLELVGLAGLGSRMPRQLSGGQQQRVALARALAHRPDVLLLDEPLGALDAKIRAELRRTLLAIQRELGIATILVTHDQEEAFELADRLGVMSFGRLLEVGEPQQLYREPKTEFVATFLGTANLLVGRATPGGIEAGPLRFSLDEQLLPLGPNRRVQALFRPEEVAVARSAAALGYPLLGEGLVEEMIFSGSYERLRVRLPALTGLRPIAPPVSYGAGSLLVDVTRTQEEARSLPLEPGASVWLGVKRIHALNHPGLRFLVLTDGSAEAQAALAVAAQIARVAHARVLLLGYGQESDELQRHLQEARERLAGGLVAVETRFAPGPPGPAVAREAERQPYDLAVLGTGPHANISLVESVLQSGEHHLLLIPAGGPNPARVLISVASGEPGKEDVLFAGRLVRHLDAHATLLAVLPAWTNGDFARARAERFLDNGVRSLALLGVPAATALRYGAIHEEIVAEMESGQHDLLVVGAPLPRRDGTLALAGVVREILDDQLQHPILIVRSLAAGRPDSRIGGLRTTMTKEVVK
jgi:sulfate/thiosulfate transport system ATP-binding protein